MCTLSKIVYRFFLLEISIFLVLVTKLYEPEKQKVELNFKQLKKMIYIESM